MVRFRLLCVLQLLAVVALVSGPTNASAKSLLDEYPVTEQFTLANGQTIGLPLQISHGSGIVLAGLADLTKLRAVLAPHGLQPIAITPCDGLIALYNMNYADTAIGPYQEQVIVIAATRDSRPSLPIVGALEDYASLLAVYVPLLRGVLPHRDRDVLFAWKLFDTTETSVRAGQDVWGFPKSLADVNVSVSATESSFEIRDGDTLVMRGARHGNLLQQLTVPIGIDAYLATPVDIQQTVSRSLAETQSRLDPFIGAWPWGTDELEFNPSHPWGAALVEVGFRPLLWQTMTSLQAVFLRP